MSGYRRVEDPSHQGRKSGDPHPDWQTNYDRWRTIWTHHKGFVKSMKYYNCQVVEHFRDLGNQKVHRILIPEFSNGDIKIPPHIINDDFVDSHPLAICTNVVFFGIPKGNFLASFNLNFHQNLQDFVNEVNFGLKINLNKFLSE